MSRPIGVAHGAWVRAWAQVDGSEAFESQHVVWLQAGGAYADMRVPFAPGAAERCFSGRSGWVDDRWFRWGRSIDLLPVDGDDVGELVVDGGDLVETGMFPVEGGEVAYVERWVRLPGDDGAYLALAAPGACLVRVGGHALTVVDDRGRGGELAAAYRREVDGAWRLELAIGDASALPGPDDLPPWPVVESGSPAVAS